MANTCLNKRTLSPWENGFRIWQRFARIFLTPPSKSDTNKQTIFGGLIVVVYQLSFMESLTTATVLGLVPGTPPFSLGSSAEDEETVWPDSVARSNISLIHLVLCDSRCGGGGLLLIDLFLPPYLVLPENRR